MAELSSRQPVVGRRVIAALIDFALLIGLFLLFAALFGQFGEVEDAPPGVTFFAFNVDGFPALVLVALGFGYFILAEGLVGATVGKKLLGLRVERRDGRRAGWGGAIVRNLFRPIDGLPVLYLLGIIVVAISDADQRLGDMAARTVVVDDGLSVAAEEAVVV